MLAGILGSTSAQGDWGTVGAWELLAPTRLGPALAYRGACASTGSLVVTANDTDGADGGIVGSTRAFAYDVAENVWKPWPDLPTLVGDPITFDVGGQVFVVDELNWASIFFMDASASRSRIGQTWTAPQGITGAPPAQRFGMRFAPFGSVVYAFSGVEVASGILHNDMYAIGAGTIITGQTLPPPAWSQVAADNVVGLPPGRVGYSWTTFGTIILLFGGVNVLPTAPAGTLPDVCFSPATSSLCEFHSHVWAFRPGNPGPPSEITVTGAQWQLLSGGATGGARPSGRFDMTGGAIGDQLFVFGGTTAAGPSQELWAFNLVSQTWAQVTPSAPAPAATTDLGYGLGAVIGRHLYHYSQPIGPDGTPVPGGGQLWRWAPVASSGSGGAAAPASAAATLSSGAVAAVAIVVLLGFANLSLLVVVARAMDALGPLGALLPCICGGTKRASAPGAFYTSTGSDGYVAPPQSA